MGYQQPLDGMQSRVDRGNWAGAPAEEEKVNSAKPENAYNKVRGSALGVVKDTVRLADLQFQLISVDVAQFWKSAQLGLIGGVVGAVILLSATTVLLVGVASQVEQLTDLSHTAALMTVGGLAAFASLILLYMSLRRMNASSAHLKRSQTEFHENMNWLRTILSQGDETTSN